MLEMAIEVTCNMSNFFANDIRSLSSTEEQKIKLVLVNLH